MRKLSQIYHCPSVAFSFQTKTINTTDIVSGYSTTSIKVDKCFVDVFQKPILLLDLPGNSVSFPSELSWRHDSALPLLMHIYGAVGNATINNSVAWNLTIMVCPKQKIHFTINHRLFNPLQTLGVNILSYKNKGTYLRGVWKIFECTYQLTAFLILKLHKNPAHQQKAHDFISIVFDHVENIFFTIWLWMVMVFLQHSTIFVIVCRLQLLWTATLCYSTLTAIWQP